MKAKRKARRVKRMVRVEIKRPRKYRCYWIETWCDLVTAEVAHHIEDWD